MDKVIIEEKLESLRRCIQRIETKRPADLDSLIQDPDLQDILVLNLTRAVQLCVDIGSHIIANTDAPSPTTMGETFTTLEKLKIIGTDTTDKMRKAVGFRNVAVHNYQKVNWVIVYALCLQHLDDFKQFAKQVARHLGL